MYCHCPNQSEALHLLTDACSPSPQNNGETSSESSTETQPTAQLSAEQMTAIQSNIQALFAANGHQVDPSNISTLFNNISTPEAKKQRVKVYAGGYFMTFDKVSSCKTRHFWRCEFKNTCNARIHTDVDRTQVLNNIHSHNHPEVADEELRLYGIDPDTIQTGEVHTVDNTADTNQRRRIRKKMADEEAARKLEEDRKNGIVNVKAEEEPNGATSSEHRPEPKFTPHHPLLSPPTHTISTTPIRSAFHAPIPTYQADPTFTNGFHGSATTSEALESIAEYSASLEMAKLLQKELKREPARRPRTTETPTPHWKFFVSQNDGTEEHLYMSMSIERRDEDSLKNALEVFCGKKLKGRIVLDFSPKIKILADQELLRRWDNDQFFLVDTNNEMEWSLKYVDDRSA